MPKEGDKIKLNVPVNGSSIIMVYDIVKDLGNNTFILSSVGRFICIGRLQDFGEWKLTESLDTISVSRNCVGGKICSELHQNKV